MVTPLSSWDVWFNIALGTYPREKPYKHVKLISSRSKTSCAPMESFTTYTSKHIKL